MERESNSDTDWKWLARYSHQRISTGTGRRGNVPERNLNFCLARNLI